MIHKTQILQNLRGEKKMHVVHESDNTFRKQITYVKLGNDENLCVCVCVCVMCDCR